MGFLDGYLVYEDKIILFDYKTDRYDQASQLIERYRGQLSLYAEALSRSYQIDQVEKYLILLVKIWLRWSKLTNLVKTIALTAVVFIYFQLWYTSFRKGCKRIYVKRNRYRILSPISFTKAKRAS